MYKIASRSQWWTMLVSVLIQKLCVCMELEWLKWERNSWTCSCEAEEPDKRIMCEEQFRLRIKMRKTVSILPTRIASYDYRYDNKCLGVYMVYHKFVNSYHLVSYLCDWCICLIVCHVFHLVFLRWLATNIVLLLLWKKNIHDGTATLTIEQGLICKWVQNCK